MAKDTSSIYPPRCGYTLQDEQMKTIAAVAKALIEAECYLEQDSTDNTMDHFGDFQALHIGIHRALQQAYHIMRVHNITEGTERFVEELKNHLG